MQQNGCGVLVTNHFSRKFGSLELCDVWRFRFFARVNECADTHVLIHKEWFVDKSHGIRAAAGGGRGRSRAFKRSGNVMYAAIAAAMVQTVVDPQM